jgi:nitroimidazol reductase NimA-like FMN-containing flavoprotein (pyridoxamine 5'-phosphate oxidase superfamily)
MNDSYPVTPRTQVRRRKQRGAYDKATVHAILDEALVCHVGFSVAGQPYVIPTIFARDGERLYLHGSIASRMLRTLAEGVDVCVTITLIDGLVLARSAFHHSMNYRSVVILGRARQVADTTEVLHAMRLVTNRVAPNRWDAVRPPTPLELKQTQVLALPLTEVSAKIRAGGVIDDETDYDLPVWAGVIPLALRRAAAEPDARLHPNAEPVD